jgi:hypothetical protein
MSRLNINNLTNENEDGSPKITGITTFSSNAFLEAPKGTTAQRPENVAPGMIRFNTDSGHLEYYTGEFWDEVLVANNTLDGGNRGLFGGGDATNEIKYITISTLGDVIDFGDLIGTNNISRSTFSSSTRGVIAGGGSPETANVEYITLSSTGSSQDFNGDLTVARRNAAGLSNSTRGIVAGGWAPLTTPTGYVNTIDYMTISSLGVNAQDFGDISTVREFIGGVSSSTRGVFWGGSGNIPASGARVNTIEYITISTTGNAIDFGDITSGVKSGTFTACNSTRGISAGGNTPDIINVIDFITTASLGNSQDFGDLTQPRRLGGSASSPTRGVFAGGYIPSSPVSNIIEYLTILSTGNSVDFGDLSTTRTRIFGLSNGHGGL